MGEFQVNPNADDELKEKILSSVNRAFTGEATNRWIVAMKDDTIVEAEETVATGSKENHLNQNMAAIIDRLFDNFKRYAFEFNRTQANRELVINCERPASMRTQAEYSEMGRQIKFCLGHLSAREWALVVQGEENRVRGYITPVEYLVGFRPNQTDFAPYIEMKLTTDPTGNSRDMVWTIDNQLLAMESLPALSRRLFGQLVKVSRGESDNTEKFVFDPHELRNQNPEVVVQRPFDAEDDGMFFSDAQKSREVPQLAPQAAPQVRPTEILAAKTFVVAQGDASATAPQAQEKLQVQAPAPAPAPAPAQAQAQAQPQAPVQAPAQPQIQVHSASSLSPKWEGGTGAAAQAGEINRKVAHAIKSLFDTVDNSIHSLTSLGVEAMHDDDLAAVSSIMKQTKTLKGLRDGIVQLSKDWQKSLEE